MCNNSKTPPPNTTPDTPADHGVGCWADGTPIGQEGAKVWHDILTDPQRNIPGVRARSPHEPPTLGEILGD